MNAGNADAGREERRAAARESFGLLSNETRLDILLALWDAIDERGLSESMGFSELYRRVDYDHPGNFSYHLKKLVGPYVRKTEDGYRLSPVGHRLVRTIVAGVTTGEGELEPTHIGKRCPLCDAAMGITYRDGTLYTVCTSCEGHFGHREDLPPGTLSAGDLDPAAFEALDPEEMLHSVHVGTNSAMGQAVEGFCNECGGPMDRTVEVCEDHDAADGLCGDCGFAAAVTVQFHCSVCKNHHVALPRSLVPHHPAVIAFYYERGFSLQFDDGPEDTMAKLLARKAATMDIRQELVSTDPVRIRVVVPYDGDELRLTLDDQLRVTDEEVVVGTGDAQSGSVPDGEE